MLIFLIKTKQYCAYCHVQYIWVQFTNCSKQCCIFFYQARFCWISFFFTTDLLQHIKVLNQQKQNQQIAFYGSTAHC